MAADTIITRERQKVFIIFSFLEDVSLDGRILTDNTVTRPYGAKHPAMPIDGPLKEVSSIIIGLFDYHGGKMMVSCLA